jgi:hypothetical protein
MVSLKERKRESILTDLKSRTAKMPRILDESDFTIQLERAVRNLDERIYNPRSVVFDDASNGLVDVTQYYIDEITNVYYSPESGESLLAGLDLGVGLMPLLSAQGMPVTSLGGITDYLILKNVLNSIQRKMMNIDDYTLLPITADGRQLLQVKNPGKLLQVEYLPYLDPKWDSWLLYENEYQYLLELAYNFIGHANVEAQAQAQLLGVGEKASTLVQYWGEKIKELQKEFEESSIINFMG